MGGGPPLRPPAALQSPQALAAYTAGLGGPQTGMAVPETRPRYEGPLSAVVDFVSRDPVGRTRGSLGQMNPAIIQQLLAPVASQGIDPAVLQQVIMQLQQGPR